MRVQVGAHSIIVIRIFNGNIFMVECERTHWSCHPERQRRISLDGRSDAQDNTGLPNLLSWLGKLTTQYVRLNSLCAHPVSLFCLLPNLAYGFS